MYSIAVTNQKGGVGKSTTTAAVAEGLVLLGYRVLMVDFDPHAGLTTGIVGRERLSGDVTLAKAVTGAWRGDPAELVHEWRPGLDLIPAGWDSVGLESAMAGLPGREMRLRRVLAPLGDTYDFCLIDSPPALNVLTDNALIAAGQMLVLMHALDSSIDALKLLIGQLDTLDQVLDQKILILGLVVNAYDSREGLIVRTSLEAIQSLRVPTLAVIQKRAVIAEAWRAKKPVIEFAPESFSANQYRELAIAVARAVA